MFTDLCIAVFRFFHVSDCEGKGPITKRGIHAAAASFFDPLGLLSPVILKAKAIPQETCRKGLDWDTSLSKELEDHGNFKTLP